ncbi:MAG: hypothetical protein ACRDTJ_24580 [Pseudonocardiaceae bacterium]
MPTLSSPLQAVALLAAIPVMVTLAIIVVAYVLVAVSGLISFAARIRRGSPPPRPLDTLSNLLE